MEESHRMEMQSRPVAGRLEGIGIPDLLWFLCERERTGLLRVEYDGMESALYFEDGRVIFASSSDPNDQLGAHLIRQNLVTLDQLDAASKCVHPGLRLGRALLEAGILTPEQLVAGVLAQLKSIVLRLFRTVEGGYYFEEGSLPSDEAITLGIPVRALIIEGIKQVRSQSLLRRNVGGAGTVYGLARDWIEILDGLDLGEGEEQLVERLEDGDRSLEVLCREVYLSSFEIYQILWAFKVLGVVEEKEARIAVEHGSYDRIPLAGEGFIEFLLRLCRSGETGVLHANRGSLERSFFLQSGRCVFATSTDLDDGLVALLLRSGVISLQDREETAKRLLTNKRVGTLLRELGAIDDDDLKTMVRQQLCEIVWDTFAWEEGEFGFVCGDLPSQEEITLDLSVEALVASGLRRLTSWTRIEQGAGGLDSVIELSPDYLEILDATGAGTEEWEVTAALKSPKTLRDLCRSSRIPDFRVVQIVWGLRMLGGIEVVSPEVSLAAEEDEEQIAAQGSGVAVEVVDLDRSLEPEIAQFELLPEDGVDDGDRAVQDDLVASPLEDEVIPPAASEEFEIEAGDDDQLSVEPLADEPDAAPTVLEVHSDEDEIEGQSAGESIEIFAGQQAEEQVEEPISPAVTSALSREAVNSALSAEAGLSASTESPVEEAEEADAATVAEQELPSIEESISPAATSILSRETVEAALSKSAEPDPATELPVEGFIEDTEEQLSPAATSILSREVVEAALSKAVSSETPPLEEEPLPETAGAAANSAAAELMHEESAAPAVFDPAVTQVLRKEDIQAALEHRGEGTATEPADGEAGTGVDELDLAMATPSGAEEVEQDETDQDLPVDLSEPVLDEWEFPEGLDELIQRFNAAQRIIYRTVKTEIGAGAANFVRSCCAQAAAEGEHDWHTAELNADGSWEIEGLKQATQASRISDPWPEYLLVIEKEIESLRLHIGDDRAAELKRAAMEG